MLTRIILFAALAVSLNAQALRRAPGFTLVDSAQTRRFHDLADYRGKVVLLDLMKTGCPNCEALTGTLEQLKAKFGDKVQVLSIVTMPDDLQKVTQYVKEHKVTSPILFDCGQVMASYLRPTSPQIHMPHLYVIDKDGYIRQDFDGAPALDVVLKAVDAALK
jgi:peroxiredoxin